jgi:GrpB-like predicted nucleotidyltransferase (UPF0157 family)
MPGQYAAAARLARRGIPVAIELYRRWQHLTPEQRERYLKLAKQYAQRAGDTARQAGDAAARQAQRRRGGR